MAPTAQEIIKRLEKVAGVSSERELSLYFGYSESTIGNRRRAGGLPLKEAMRLAIDKGVSLDWLVLGRESAAYDAVEDAGIEQRENIAEPTAAYAKEDAKPAIERDYATRLVLAIVDGVERALDTADTELSIERKTKAVGALFRMFAIRGTLPTQAEIDSIIELMQ